MLLVFKSPPSVLLTREVIFIRKITIISVTVVSVVLSVCFGRIPVAYFTCDWIGRPLQIYFSVIAIKVAVIKILRYSWNFPIIIRSEILFMDITNWAPKSF